METAQSKDMFFSKFIRPTDLQTFKTSILYFLIGILLLFYWEGTWACLALLYEFLPPLEWNAIIFTLSLFIIFNLGSFSPLLVAHVQPDKASLAKNPKEASNYSEVTMLSEKALVGESKGDGNLTSAPNCCKPWPNASLDTQKCSYTPVLKDSTTSGWYSICFVLSFKDLQQIFTTLKRLAFIYVFELASVGSWFGPWGLIDHLAEHFFEPLHVYLIIHATVSVMLVCSGKLSYVVVTPFHSSYERDGKINLYIPLLYKNHQPRTILKLVMYSFIRTAFFGNMVFLFWYSAWGLISLIVFQILPQGFESLPLIALPFLAFTLFIPNFFVLSYLRNAIKNKIGLTLLIYIQGLCNITFWIFLWTLSAGAVTDPDWKVAYPVLCHALSFLLLAVVGLSINLGI